MNNEKELEASQRFQTNLPLMHEMPVFENVEDERKHRKERLAAAFRIFGRYGFSEGVAGHITARDPEETDCFWVNPFGMNFSHISVSDLLLVNHNGDVIEGNYAVNQCSIRYSFEYIWRDLRLLQLRILTQFLVNLFLH